MQKKKKKKVTFRVLIHSFSPIYLFHMWLKLIFNDAAAYVCVYIYICAHVTESEITSDGFVFLGFVLSQHWIHRPPCVGRYRPYPI